MEKEIKDKIYDIVYKFSFTITYIEVIIDYCLHHSEVSIPCSKLVYLLETTKRELLDHLEQLEFVDK